MRANARNIGQETPDLKIIVTCGMNKMPNWHSLKARAHTHTHTSYCVCEEINQQDSSSQCAAGLHCIALHSLA